MYDFDTKIKEAKKVVDEVQEEQAKVEAAFKVAGSKIGKIGLDLDIENATLEQVQAQQETMNANIAELIIGLDEVTNSFGEQFSAMRERSGWESFVGVFSKAKAESMREARVRNTDIDAKLNDLISKSNVIITILQEQLGVLDGQESKISTNLETILQDRVQVVDELEAIRDQLKDMDPKIIEAENAISMATSPATRTKLEADLQKLNETHNESVQQEQVKLALSQTYEKYIKMCQTFVDSLQNQRATQMVLVDKLQTDTKQRVVLYDALSKSLKTAQQQDVAHRINEIGSAVDNEAQGTMAHIGSATNQRMAEMMEKHKDSMAYAEEVQKEKAKSDERFARRFAKIIEEHDRAQYRADV